MNHSLVGVVSKRLKQRWETESEIGRDYYSKYKQMTESTKRSKKLHEQKKGGGEGVRFCLCCGKRKTKREKLVRS